MLRTQPDRGRIFGWLYVVATREASRLSERDRRDLAVVLHVLYLICTAGHAGCVDLAGERFGWLANLASLPTNRRRAGCSRSQLPRVPARWNRRHDGRALEEYECLLVVAAQDRVGFMFRLPRNRLPGS